MVVRETVEHVVTLNLTARLVVDDGVADAVEMRLVAPLIEARGVTDKGAEKDSDTLAQLLPVDVVDTEGHTLTEGEGDALIEAAREGGLQEMFTWIPALLMTHPSVVAHNTDSGLTE